MQPLPAKPESEATGHGPKGDAGLLLGFFTHYFPDPEKKWIVMLLAYVSQIRLSCSCKRILCYQQNQSDLL